MIGTSANADLVGWLSVLRAVRPFAGIAAAVLACAALLGWAQFSVPGLVDTDSYFHTRAAERIAAEGFRRDFPQAAFSTWADRYSDKDLLFHLFLIPFQKLHAGEDLVVPGKIAAVAASLLFFAAFAVSLRLVGARAVPFWIVLYFVADPPLLYDFVLVRPGVLGTGFFVLECAWIVANRNRALAVTGALHTLAHSSFPLLPGVAVAAAAARLLRREPIPWKTVASALGGVAAGLLLNPYFPNNLAVAWDQVVGVAREVWLPGAAIPPFLFGPELLRPPLAAVLGGFPGFVPALSGAAAFAAIPRRRFTTGGLALLLMSAVPLAAGLLSERFLGFFFPIAILAGARLWADLLAGASLGTLRKKHAAGFAAVVAIFGTCLVAGAADGSVLALRVSLLRLGSAEALRPAVRFVSDEAAPGDLVYHSFWWDFSVLYHDRPDGRYVVALDPVFFHRKDPALFAKALDLHLGRSPDAYRVLKEDFGAAWVFLPKVPRSRAFFELMTRDDRFRKAYEDDHAIVIRVR